MTTGSAATVVVGGFAAVLGGLLDTAAVYVHSLAPEGAVGQGSETQPVVTFASASILLTIFGLLGFAALARARGRAYQAAIAAAVLVAAGFASLTGFSDYLAGTTDELWWWGLGPSGFLMLWVGLVLGGVHALLTGIVPRWTGAVATVTSAVLPFFSTQTAAVLVAVPGSLAWALVGGFMLREALADLDIGRRRALVIGA